MPKLLDPRLGRHAGAQGQEARMHQPATINGNWQWRVRRDDLSDGLAERLLGVTGIYGRI